jgi:nucleoside-diphosphate-sugar epimerase
LFIFEQVSILEFKLNMENDLILVTGASGYIACHIVKKLMEKGYRVRGTVRSLKDEKKVAPLRNLVQNPKHELELVEADLLKEEKWSDAVKGCTFVIHTASPFPNSSPKDENELITPAVNGTLYVLRACVQEGSKVKRVVLTSSVAAIAGSNFENNRTYTEKDWPNVDILDPYSKSKTLAEKSAWNFLEERKKNKLPCFELAVINPGYVMVIIKLKINNS